jgi:hemerythrin-like domain-containing protein
MIFYVCIFCGQDAVVLIIMKQENKPIQRSPQLAPLSREHHDGLLFVWKVRQGLKNKTAIDKLRQYSLWYWKEHTKPHFYQEEKILLPYLPDDDPMAQQLKNEHTQIRELVLSLDKEPDQDTFILLTDLAEKHIRWEERQLFPYLEKTLTTEQLESIFTALQLHPVSCDDWTDVFWVKK